MSAVTTLNAASQVQSMAASTGNEKLAFTLTGLSVVLVGLMVYREVNHCLREQFREHDRRSVVPDVRSR
jgi:hypothetical protein